MLEELEERIELGELISEELPTIKTIEGWISRFATSHKKSMAQKILEENQIKIHEYSINFTFAYHNCARNHFILNQKFYYGEIQHFEF